MDRGIPGRKGRTLGPISIVAVLGLCLVIAPSAQAQQGNRALVYLGSSTFPDNGQTQLAAAFAAAGAAGTDVDATLGLPPDLTPYRIIVLFGPDLGLDAVTEAQLISFYVAGGTLVAVGDFGSSGWDAGNPPLNQLATSLGIGMQLVSAQVALGCSQNASVDPHSLTAGVTAIEVAAASRVTGGTRLAYYGGDTLLAVEGKFVMAGDTQIFDDLCLSYGNPFDPGTNTVFFENLWGFAGPSTLCGDGFQDPGEECDDGVDNGTTVCGCQLTCQYGAAGTACGNPAGTQCDFPDSCDGFGSCDPGFAPAGAPCGDQGVECLNDDSCDGAGFCVDAGLAPVGAPCGSPADTACDNPDSCDGAGGCVGNFEPAGTACGDQGIECRNDDSCDGAGACADAGNAPAGAPCGSPADTACDNPDSCDGAGNCDANFEAPGAACGDQGVVCRVNDACDGGGACIDNGFLPAGAPCGDPTGTECDLADGCDGAGSCLENLAPAGAPCGDQAVECLADDGCDGAGACIDAGYLPGGTPCGDPSDTDCDDPDLCDGLGTCLANQEPAGTACGDQGIECVVDDSCNGNGVCLDHGYVAAGTACGDPSDGECDDPDACDGAGACLGNQEPAGAPCGDQGVACHVDDTCDGSGACVDNGLLPEGAACGDPLDNACTDPDSCDAAGACLEHHAPSGTPCGDQGVACHVDDTCDGAGGCVDNGLLLAGSPCGDPVDDECTDPDTCDDAGACLSHDAPGGAPCGDQGVPCHADDYCDGAGGCQDNGLLPEGTACGDDPGNPCTYPGTCEVDGSCSGGYAPEGTACGDPSDGECDDPDACDDGGVCRPRHEANGTPCTDNGMFCDGSEVCLTGDCVSAGDPCGAGEVCDEDQDACTPDMQCGNGAREGTEQCDDANNLPDDGCSATCEVETGWVCVPDPGTGVDVCTGICGDGLVRGGEGCDDDNDVAGDGCSSCQVEEGWVCDDAEPSQCSEASFCGDGVIDEGEECDDDNNRSNDGCSFECDVEEDYLCEGEPSECTFVPPGKSGGCGCSLDGGGPFAGWFALAALLVLALPRRRRRG